MTTLADLMATVGNGSDSAAKLRAFRRAVRSSVGQPLLFHLAGGHGAILGAVLERVARGERVYDEELDEVFAGRSVVAQSAFGSPRAKNAVILSMRGVALYDLEHQPYCYSTLALAQNIKRAAADPAVDAIILDIDSPGGQVTGTGDAGDAVYAARQVKPVVAYVSPLCASAAYWIGSQASAVVASTKSADIGSVGVFMAHTDCSEFNAKQGMKRTYIHAGEFKVEGNSDEPLSDAGKAHYQSEVDSIYRDFIAAVARGRDVSAADVRARFGKGRTMMAPAALEAGMIDSIGDFATAMSFADRRKTTAARLALMKRTDASRNPAAAARRRHLDMLR